MKYWSFLAAKLALAGGLACGVWWALSVWLPLGDPFTLGIRKGEFAPQLATTFVVFLYFMFCLGLLYAVILDQRYRCRTCLRRLRMPITKGSWTHVLLGPPRTEYICPYGHGTLKVPDLQINPQPADWEPHEDMWKELFSAKESDK